MEKGLLVPDSIAFSVYLCQFLYPGTKPHKGKAVNPLAPTSSFQYQLEVPSYFPIHTGAWGSSCFPELKSSNSNTEVPGPLGPQSHPSSHSWSFSSFIT